MNPINLVLAVLITLVGCAGKEPVILQVGQDREAVITALNNLGAIDVGPEAQVMSTDGVVGYPEGFQWKLTDFKIVVETSFADGLLSELVATDQAATKQPKSKIPNKITLKRLVFHPDRTTELIGSD